MLNSWEHSRQEMPYKEELVVQNEVQHGLASFLDQSAIVWKTALGSGIVWEIARLTGSRHPYLAPLTFILCLQTTIGQSIRYALYRSLGTVIGVLLIGFFAKSIPVTAWALAVALFASTALMKAFRANDFLIHQVALSVLFVLYFENHSSGYAWDRAKDTLIGAIVGVLFIVLVFPPNALRKTEQAIDACVQRFVKTSGLVADALQQNLLHSTGNPQELLNALLDDVDQVTESLKKAKQGAPFQFYVSKAKMEKVTQQCHRVRDACVHFVTLTRSFTENMTQTERDQWSNRVRSLAAEVPAFVYRDSPSYGETEEMLATAYKRQTVAAFDPDVSDHELRKIIDALRGSTLRTKV